MKKPVKIKLGINISINNLTIKQLESILGYLNDDKWLQQVIYSKTEINIKS